MATFGKLSVIASHDIGALAPQNGNPVIFNWSVFINLIQLLPWVLMLSLFLLKDNRRWQAWMILIPVIIVYAGFILARRMIPLMNVEATQIIGWLILGVTVLMLLSNKLRAHSRLVVFFLSLGIMFVVGAVNALSSSYMSFSELGVFSLINYGIVTFIMLGGMSLARFLNRILGRKRSTLKHFIFSLPVVLLLVSIVILWIFYTVWIFSGVDLYWGMGILMDSLVYGTILGIILYYILFPFLIMTFYNSVYRTRLQAVFGFEKAESRLGGQPKEQKEEVKQEESGQ